MQVQLFKHTAFGKESLGITTDVEYARKYAKCEGRRSGVHVSVEPVTEDDVLAALDDDAYELEQRVAKWEGEAGTVDYNGRFNVAETLYLHRAELKTHGWSLRLHHAIEAGYRELE